MLLRRATAEVSSPRCRRRPGALLSRDESLHIEEGLPWPPLNCCSSLEPRCDADAASVRKRTRACCPSPQALRPFPVYSFRPTQTAQPKPAYQTAACQRWPLQRGGGRPKINTHPNERHQSGALILTTLYTRAAPLLTCRSDTLCDGRPVRIGADSHHPLHRSARVLGD